MNKAADQGQARQRWVGALTVLVLHVGLFYALVSGLKPHSVAIHPPAFQVALLPEAPAPAPRPLPPHPASPIQTPSVPVQMEMPAPVPPAATVSIATPQSTGTALPSTLPAHATVRRGVNPIYIPPLEELQRRYPREARREGLSGRVIIRLTVAPGGNVIRAVVRQSTPTGLFDALALDFVRRFRFQPSTEEFLVDQELVFKLDQ